MTDAELIGWVGIGIGSALAIVTLIGTLLDRRRNQKKRDEQ